MEHGDGYVPIDTGANTEQWRGSRRRRGADVKGHRHKGVRAQEMRAFHDALTIPPTAEAMLRVRRAILIEDEYENESETKPTEDSDAETMPDLEEREE